MLHDRGKNHDVLLKLLGLWRQKWHTTVTTRVTTALMNCPTRWRLDISSHQAISLLESGTQYAASREATDTPLAQEFMPPNARIHADAQCAQFRVVTLRSSLFAG